MPERAYTEYAKLDSDNQLGSPPLRFPEGWKGSDVNGAMAALASAVRNLATPPPSCRWTVTACPTPVSTAARSARRRFQHRQFQPHGRHAPTIGPARRSGADLRPVLRHGRCGGGRSLLRLGDLRRRTVNGVTARPTCGPSLSRAGANARRLAAQAAAAAHLARPRTVFTPTSARRTGHALTESELPWQRTAIFSSAPVAPTMCRAWPIALRPRTRMISRPMRAAFTSTAFLMGARLTFARCLPDVRGS